MQILSRQTAAENLLSFTGATIICFTAKTEVSKISAKSKFKGVFKVVNAQVILGTDYLKKILREQKKEDNEVGYELSERTNGLQKEGKCLSSKGDSVYLDMVNVKILDSKHYYPNGEELAPSEVEDMYRNNMIPSYYTGLAKLAEKQGVSEENAIRFNSYKFDNILTLSWGGEDYTLTGTATLAKEGETETEMETA